MYAEELGHYWKTSESSPDSWLDKAAKQIESLGGHVFVRSFGLGQNGRAAYCVEFSINDIPFKIIWPVLESKYSIPADHDILAARRQSATLLFHDVKARCLSSKIIGVKAAFFNFLMLPDGRMASEATIPELTLGLPEFAGPRPIQIEEPK